MSAYAVIKTGGKQYRVALGDIIDVELLELDGAEECTFKEVLFYSDGDTVALGEPIVENAVVKAAVLGVVRGEKVIAYKYKKRKNYHRKVGHRQNSTRVKITDISL